MIAHLDDLCIYHWLFVSISFSIIPTERRVHSNPLVGCSLQCLSGSEFCTFRCKLRLCELAVEVRRLCNGAARCKSLLLLSAVRALDLDLAAGLRYGAPPTTNNTIKTPPVRLSLISAPFLRCGGTDTVWDEFSTPRPNLTSITMFPLNYFHIQMSTLSR